MEMQSNSHTWIGGFAIRLMQLQSNLRPVVAVHIAVMQHPVDRRLQPQMAAEAFVRAQVRSDAAPYHQIFSNAQRS